jgi:hypothetical protein
MSLPALKGFDLFLVCVRAVLVWLKIFKGYMTDANILAQMAVIHSRLTADIC